MSALKPARQLRALMHRFLLAPAVFLGAVSLGCTPAAGTRADAGETKNADAATTIIDAAGSVTAAAAPDAGPADDGLPSSSSPDLPVRGRHLLEAIARDNAELAMDIVFPRDAFAAARDVPDPAKAWEKKLFSGFEKDVHLMSKRLKGADHAQEITFELGHSVTQITPKKKDWKKPLWRVKHSKLTFTLDGKTQRIEIAEMTSWRGAWYITNLR